MEVYGNFSYLLNITRCLFYKLWSNLDSKRTINKMCFRVGLGLERYSSVSRYLKGNQRGFTNR